MKKWRHTVVKSETHDPMAETEAAWEEAASASLRSPSRTRPDKVSLTYRPRLISTEPTADHAWFSAGITSALVRRFGASPIDRLRWLVEDFARRNDYRDGRTGLPLRDEVTPSDVARELLMFILYQNGPGTAGYLGSPTVPNISAKMLRELSAAVSDGVARYLRGEEWAVAVPAQTTRTIRSDEILLGRDKGKRWVRTSWLGPGRVRGTHLDLMFLLAAQDLVASEFEYLARCEGCDTVFVRDDLRQTYCTPRCAHNKRMRTLRHSQKERVATAKRSKK